MSDLLDTVDADTSDPAGSVKSFVMKTVVSGVTLLAVLLGYNFIAKPGAEQAQNMAGGTAEGNEIAETWGDI